MDQHETNCNQTYKTRYLKKNSTDKMKRRDQSKIKITLNHLCQKPYEARTKHKITRNIKDCLTELHHYQNVFKYHENIGLFKQS